MQLPKRFNHLVELVDDDITFGVEFEFYSDYDHSTIVSMLNENGFSATNGGNTRNSTSYCVKGDGSLSCDGVEIATKVFKGKEGLVELRKFLKFIKSNNIPRENNAITRSCGTHIHLGSFGNDRDVARTIYNLWERHERQIDQIVSRSRRDNANYCHSILDLGLNTLLVEKFYKLSFRNFEQYGTFENRQHQGTLNFSKIAHWIIFNQRIIRFAVDTKRVFSSENLASFFTGLIPKEISSESIDKFVAYLGDRVEEFANRSSRTQSNNSSA